MTDFDGDGHLGPGDLMEMLDYYTGKDEKLDDVHKERLVQEVYTYMTIHTYVCKCICMVDYVWMHDKCTNSLGVHMMVWHMYQLYCLNSAAVQILSELNKSTNSRAGLHLQDFRVAINRSPDFSKYVGYILFIAAVQTAYCL